MAKTNVSYVLLEVRSNKYLSKNYKGWKGMFSSTEQLVEEVERAKTFTGIEVAKRFARTVRDNFMSYYKDTSRHRGDVMFEVWSIKTIVNECVSTVDKTMGTNGGIKL